MLNVRHESIVKFNDQLVKFLAFQTEGKPDGPYKIKYQIDDPDKGFGKLQYCGIVLTLNQWEHFKHDINPTDPLYHFRNQATAADIKALHPWVRDVIDGNAEHLGRGNSWNGYRVGSRVVKLSSIVPYVWQNHHAYLSVEESAAQARREVMINQAFATPSKMRGRIAHITDVDYVGGKVAVTMPYLEPVANCHVTPEQADYLEESIRILHRLGWAYLDQFIGWGLDQTGTPLIYDLSTCRHRSEAKHKTGWQYWVEDDLGMIARFRKSNELPDSEAMARARAIRKKRHQQIIKLFAKAD